MPSFVPVVDVETPASERDPHSKEYAKHRQWEAPHSKSTKSNNSSMVNRGWEQGNVGWGVLGAFGSSDKDDGSHIRRQSGEQKMIKNEKGLWVRVKDESSDGSGLSIGRGRGRGISASSALSETKFESSKEKEVISDKDTRGRYDNDSDSDHESSKRAISSRDYRTERSRSPVQRHRDSGDYSQSHRERYRDDSRGRRDSKSYRRDRNSRDRYRRDRSRDRSRSRSGRRDKDRISSKHYHKSPCDETPNQQPQSDSQQNKPTFENSNHIEEEALLMGDITAVQVVNRLIEVFQHPTKNPDLRLSNILELFADDAKISSLKTGKDLLVGSANIRASFSKTQPCDASTSKRIFVESHSKKNSITFALDIHHPGTSPGLGDRSKDVVLLYKCMNAKIVQVWGMTDVECLAAPSIIGSIGKKDGIYSSNAWKNAKLLILKDLPDLNETEDAHFHDYDHLETWG